MLHGGHKALHNPTGRVMRARARPVEVNLAIQQQAVDQQAEDEVECQKENLMAQWRRLDAMGTGPGLGGIPDPNPNPNHASDAKYEHPNSHDHRVPDNKLKQAYFVCGDERLEVLLPHPKGWVKGKPAKTTGKAYHANQGYRKKAKQGSKPCTPKSCDRRSRSDQAGNWRMPLGGTPETNVGEKLALSLDSVAVKSTEPAEAAANAAAAVGQAAPSVPQI